MGLFYTVSDKESLNVRNQIFLTHGLPALEENGFKRSPFSTAWFGRDNLKDFTYELCRLSDDRYLEIVMVYITRGDRWIKVYLNVFELNPHPESLSELERVDGLQFWLPPNTSTKMRLHIDDVKGVPLFSYDFMFGGHKLNRYCTKWGLNRSIATLSKLINKDMTNIDTFIKRWHELHTPNVTDWEGNKLD